MLNIKIPFGYNSFCFDHSFVLYTGKIRVKSSMDNCINALMHCTQLKFTESTRDCTTISFTTTCSITNEQLIEEINAMLCKIMHARIDAKYAKRKDWEPEMIEYKPQLVGAIDLTKYAL